VKYPRREKAHWYCRDGKIIVKDDPGGVGQEIVREENVCPECFASTM
jgi:hypothetical protein